MCAPLVPPQRTERRSARSPPGAAGPRSPPSPRPGPAAGSAAAGWLRQPGPPPSPGTSSRPGHGRVQCVMHIASRSYGVGRGGAGMRRRYCRVSTQVRETHSTHGVQLGLQGRLTTAAHRQLAAEDCNPDGVAGGTNACWRHHPRHGGGAAGGDGGGGGGGHEGAGGVGRARFTPMVTISQACHRGAWAGAHLHHSHRLWKGRRPHRGRAPCTGMWHR